jgi:hypothetical protein
MKEMRMTTNEVLVDSARLQLAVLKVAKAKAKVKIAQEELRVASNEYGAAIVEFKQDACNAHNMMWEDG